MIPYIFLIAGFLSLIIFLILRDKNSSVQAVLAKTLTSVFFIMTAVFAFVENGNNNDVTELLMPAGLVILGLVLGMVGDITLDLKVYFKSLVGKFENAEKDSDSMMYFGMISFGIGHLLYIASSAMRYSDYIMNLLWSAIIAVVLTAIVFVVSLKVLKMKFGKFLIPCICYSILLCWFVGISAANMIACGASTVAIIQLIGSILFLVSDLVLSMTYFSKPEDYQKAGPLNPESRLMISVNHVTYYAAQFLIAIMLLFI